MKRLFQILISLLSLGLLAGCATEPMVSRSIQTTAYPPVPSVRFSLPALPDGYMRLYIYRPQTFTGMMDNPVVTIDGKLTGNPKNSYENRFLPGAVFVVDTPGNVAHVSWLWQYDTTDKVLNLTAERSRTWYLRWHIPKFNLPGERYLEITSEETALKEISALRYTGYLKLEQP